MPLPPSFNDVTACLAEYSTRMRFKKLGIVSNFDDLDEQTALELIEIDIGVEKEQKRARKHGKSSN